LAPALRPLEENPDMKMPNPRDPNRLETARIVARYRNGTVRKGTSQDFTPSRPTFHIQPEEGGPPQVVPIRDLKALFFVKDLQGNAHREDFVGFLKSPMETSQGKKIAVLFQDGELICGHTLTWTPGRDGFFMVPSDPAGNNIRIYVVAASALMIKAGPAAEALAEQMLKDKKRHRAA
jgi:hypothetical protein